jgi:glycerol-3-phosphate acyltransferase PlsY
MKELAVIVIGYLMGSVLSADLLARARGIDIRAVGTGNPGASNAFVALGPVAGMFTTAYDMSVGLLAMAVARALVGSEVWVYAAGAAAVAGHVFPAFFRFRGGQGMAASAGMIIFGVVFALMRGWLSAPGLLLLALIAVAILVATHSGKLTGLAVLPILAVELLMHPADWAFVTFMCALCAWVVTVQILLVRGERPQAFGPLGDLVGKLIGGQRRA